MVALWISLGVLLGVLLGMWVRDRQHAKRPRFKAGLRNKPYSDGAFIEVVVSARNTYIVKTLATGADDFEEQLAEAMAVARSRASVLTASLRH